MANDLKDLQKLLDRAAKEMPEKALRIIGVEGTNFIAKNFEDQGFNDTGLEKWKERATEDKRERDITRYKTNRVITTKSGKGKATAGELNKYGRQNQGRAILVGHDTGGNKLKNSFTKRINVGAKTITWVNPKPYASRHNEGLKGMPKREFLGPSEYLNGKIGAKIQKELDKLFK